MMKVQSNDRLADGRHLSVRLLRRGPRFICIRPLQNANKDVNQPDLEDDGWSTGLPICTGALFVSLGLHRVWTCCSFFYFQRDKPQSTDKASMARAVVLVSLLGEVPLYLGLELLDFLVSQVNELIDFVDLIGQLLLHGN